MGDMNAKVGSEQDPLKEIVGDHGFGERNERGDLWVEWCTLGSSINSDTYTHGRVRVIAYGIGSTT